MRATIKLTGVTDWAQLLLQTADEYPDILTEIVTDLGLFLEANAKANCPVDFGRLRASIGHYTPEDLAKDGSESSDADAHWEIKHFAKGVSVEIGTNVRYAEYVEFGTSRIVGRFFFAKAVQATENYLPSAVIHKLSQYGIM